MKAMQLRKEKLIWRDHLLINQKEKRDSIITGNVIQCQEFINSQRIFTYMSFGSEVYTDDIINYALNKGKEVYIPRTYVKDKKLRFYAIKSIEDTISGYRNIREPKNSDVEIKPQKNDLILIPGSVFDCSGNRYGYGAGFYDRYLADITNDCIRMGLCYHEQLVDEIMTLSTDIPMTHLVTDQNVYRFEEGKR